MTDFKALLRALGEGGVEFILIGGAAATVHGSSRLTRDVDVVYCRTSENIARLVAALTPYQPYLRGAPPGLRQPGREGQDVPGSLPRQATPFRPSPQAR